MSKVFKIYLTIFKGFQRHKQYGVALQSGASSHVWLSTSQPVRLWCCVTVVKCGGEESSDIRVSVSVSVSNERWLDWGAICCFSRAAPAIWSLPVVFSCCLALAFLTVLHACSHRFVLLRKMSKQIISETTQLHPQYKSSERERRSDDTWNVAVGVSRRPL